MKRLGRNFWTQPSLIISKELLGKYVVRRLGKKLRIGMVVETESYPTHLDRASHAYNFRRTARTEIEWLQGGCVYIYMVYGMY